MSKKLREMIRENQRLNHINIKMFAVAAKAVETEEKEENTNKSTKNIKKMKKNNKNFKSSIVMALSAGKSTESSFKMYAGIAPIGCKLVCPTKEQLSQLIGREWTKDMNYLKTDEQGVKQVNITFPMTVDTTVNGEKVHIMVLQTIPMWNAPQPKSDGSKFQVVDKWGNFNWVTENEFNNHITPLSAAGKKLKIDASTWRRAYRGEENLMKFLKPRLNIDDAFDYKNEEWVLKTDPEKLSKCECRLDEVAKYFDGNVSEIQNALNLMPENKVKGFVYVTEYNGKQRQAIGREYTYLSSSKLSNIEKEIMTINDKNNTSFAAYDLKEYTVESTQFNPSAVQMPEAANPFAEPQSPWAN